MKANDTLKTSAFSATCSLLLTFGGIDFPFQEVYDWLGADFKIPLFFYSCAPSHKQHGTCETKSRDTETCLESY